MPRTSILFLCTGNSARSIMAEAVANQRFGDVLLAHSAGSQPKAAPNPLALETLRRHGLATDGLASESWTQYEHTPFDVVITLCGSAARETCPAFPGKAHRAHWGFPDPPAQPDPAATFERVFDGLVEAIGMFVRDSEGDPAKRADRVAHHVNTSILRPMATEAAVTTADPVALLDNALRAAIHTALGDEYADEDPVIRASQNPEFGDFQANCAMALAKRLGMKPRDIAAKIVDAADLSVIADPPELAGPGFINLRLKTDALAGMLGAMAGPAARLGVPPDDNPSPIVIDMCAVNVAKQMHVGHLRSTIIGDAIGRVLERRGRVVYRENHLGDWGLPIAMVLQQLRAAGVNLKTLELVELDAAYRAAQLETKSDTRGLEAAQRLKAGPHRLAELEEQNAGAAELLEAAKTTLVKLQQGDPELDRDWHLLIDCTLRALYEAIDLLNVRLGPENNRGESFYRDRLAGVIDSYVEAGIATEDDGALVVAFTDRERPLLIRKSDGGFLYATTDLAAVRYRANELGADRVIYVVDARQRDHFRDVFDAVRLIGWDRTPDGTSAELTHLPFGSVLGPDKRPLKTRAGDNVTLRSLLEEACERGTAEVRARAADPNAPTHGLSEAELAAIGRAVGIAAIKYADLSSDLVRDYVFDMDRMVAFEGNTGPYLQYAHARICSIFTRAGLPLAEENAVEEFAINAPEEKALSLVLLRYGGIVADVARTLEPHRLCSYLYDLAGAYSAFYQRCPVLKAEDPDVRTARLALCNLTRRVLADGLDLLGIEAPHRM